MGKKSKPEDNHVPILLVWCHPQVQKKSSLFLNGNTKISTAAAPEAVSAEWVVNHIQDRCCFDVFPNCLNTKVWDMMTLQLHSKYASQDSSFHICPYILLLCGLIRLYYNLCAEKRTHMQRVINSSAQSIHCSPPPMKGALVHPSWRSQMSFSPVTSGSLKKPLWPNDTEALWPSSPESWERVKTAINVERRINSRNPRCLVPNPRAESGTRGEVVYRMTQKWM